MSESSNTAKRAVALKYDPKQDHAPIVVASGMGYMAERITEAALANGVPVYEDSSIATLLSQLKLGAEIPQELYQAVVDIYVYFLKFVPESNLEDNKEEKMIDGRNETEMELTKENGL